jgi:hypothetical protein
MSLGYSDTEYFSMFLNVQYIEHNCLFTVKKSLAIFPAGLFPPRESLVSDIPAGGGK